MAWGDQWLARCYPTDDGRAIAMATSDEPQTNRMNVGIVQQAWDRWYEVVLEFIVAPTSWTPPKPHFEDLWLEGAGLLPSRLLRPELTQLTLFDWTELVIHGAMTSIGSAAEANLTPVWALNAGLRVLGLDATSIGRLVNKNMSMPLASPKGAVGRLLEGIGPANKAALFFCRGRTLPPGAPDPNYPGLYVDERDINYSAPALVWLKDAEVFEEAINDQR